VGDGSAIPEIHTPVQPLNPANVIGVACSGHTVRAIGAEDLHFHDLCHTGNAFAAASGAGLRDLMARMGHDSERAIIYQHAARGADQTITEAMGAHIEAQQAEGEDGTDGTASGPRPAG
jgi:hypothetical protein